MSVNGQSDAHILSWPKRLLSADDLRRHLNGQRELQLLPRTIVTPLAADELRARGVRITWVANPQAGRQPSGARWGYAQEAPDPLVTAAVQALEREGTTLAALPSAVREIAGQVVRAE